VTRVQGIRPGPSAGPLPRREPGARLDSGGQDLSPGPATDQAPGPGAGTAEYPADTYPGHPAAHAELIALRDRVPGVRGCVIAGIDGVLIGHDLTADPEPLNLAALAAATFRLGRQSGLALRHGPFRELTVRSQKGYFSVYAVSDAALLAVLGDDWVNVNRLHQEARPVTERLADLLHVGGTT